MISTKYSKESIVQENDMGLYFKEFVPKFSCLHCFQCEICLFTYLIHLQVTFLLTLTDFKIIFFMNGFEEFDYDIPRFFFSHFIFRVYWASWIFGFTLFFKFGKFLAFIFSNSFFCLSTLESQITCILGLKLSDCSLIFSHFKNSFFLSFILHSFYC